MYIIEWCLRYGHTCGYDEENPETYFDFLHFRNFEISCPGKEECEHNKIYQVAHIFEKDRYEAPEKYIKEHKRYLKTRREFRKFNFEITIDYIREGKKKYVDESF